MTLIREDALLACFNCGVEHWTIIGSLLETCKLNDVDPLAYFTDALT
ncbi:transposase domain-containing protein [Bradyrhizobium brasilense]|nr:transposase domain-containing protein [Bradyrhizobium brasilense]